MEQIIIIALLTLLILDNLKQRISVQTITLHMIKKGVNAPTSDEIDALRKELVEHYLKK